MDERQKDRGIGRWIVGIVVIVILAAIAYVVFSQGETGSVPDETNDEMEVVPS